MLTYQKTPVELLKIIDLFSKNKMDYLLFKCEHVFGGKNSNLDVLFRNGQNYNNASNLLKKEGFVLYLPEKVEKYKRMFVKVIKNQLYAIHLHREIAWHGLKVLNKELIFQRKKELNEIIAVPSKEDSLLIHSAHILFENFKIKERERQLISGYLQEKNDWQYINSQLRKNGWKKGFYKFLNRFKKDENASNQEIIGNYLNKLIKNPSEAVYLFKKIIKHLFTKINLRRKGNLVALIGVNGAGKTTLTKETLTKYAMISNFFNGQFGYYFGWEPFLPITKIISKRLKKKNKKVFNELNKKESGLKSKFSLIKEAILVYNYIEYLSRYIFIIYPKLRTGKLVFTDRYFYDLYAQYNYAPKSKIIKLLFSIYPKPDYLFVLDAKLETITKRDKNIEIFSKTTIKSSQRKVHETDYLKEQKERYGFLCRYFDGELLNTEQPIDLNINQIIQKTWVGLVK